MTDLKDVDHCCILFDLIFQEGGRKKNFGMKKKVFRKPCPFYYFLTQKNYVDKMVNIRYSFQLI